MGKYRITTISDTHTKHKSLTNDLIGGDILIHSGDISSMGYPREIENFCKWFDKINNYDIKIFIAGNHDYLFQDEHETAMEIVNSYKWITYLQDDWVGFGKGNDVPVKIYGSPWQPEFYNWAFNLPRAGTELEQKWNMIPDDTDILVTHGPAWGYGDVVFGRYDHLGCERLIDRVMILGTPIHVFGHIHSGYGYSTDGTTHFINSSVLNESYTYGKQPIITFDWEKDGNIIEFL